MKTGEINTLIQAAKQNDSQAIEKLITLILPHVNRLKQSSTLNDYEDQSQVARVAIWQAIKSFNPECGASFTTWAINRARTHILDSIRLDIGRPRQPRYHITKKKISLDAGENNYEHIPEAYQDFTATIANKEEVEHLLSTLPKNYADCLRSSFLHGNTYAETGKILGLTTSAVAANIRRALEKLSG